MAIASQQPQDQDWLHDGLVVERRISSKGSFGDVYLVRDERHPECGAPRLRIRITPRSPETSWEKPFQERLRKIYGRFWAYVSPPNDARRLEDGRWLLSHSAPTATLADKLQVGKGLGPDFARHFAEQLLTGLAELHRHGLHHGGLCPENVWIESQGNGQEAFAVALGDVEIGDMATWSKNEHLEHYDSRYHSADRNGIDRDLYATGIMLVELLRGKQDVQTALEKQKDLGGDLSSHLPSVHLSFPKAARLEELARNLLLSSENHLADPQKALAFLRKPSWRWVAAVGVMATAGALALILFVWLWSAARNEVRDLAEKNIVHTQQISDLTKDRNDWKHKAENPTPPSPTPPPSTPASQRQWTGIVTHVGGAGDYFDQILKQVEAEIAAGKAPAEFVAWHKTVDDYHAKFAGWERSDTQGKSLPQLFREVVQSPWEQSFLAAFDARKRTLEAAARPWRDWVNDPVQMRQNIDSAVMGLQSAEQIIIRRWIGDFNNKTQWTLRLKHQQADQGKVTIKSPCYVTIDAKERAQQKFDTPNPYDQSFDGLAGRDISFVWQPNDPLTVYLEDSGWVSNDVADGTFPGPFALQRLHWEGKIVGPDGRATLEFDVLDCPGPPRPPRLPLP